MSDPHHTHGPRHDHAHDHANAHTHCAHQAEHAARAPEALAAAALHCSDQGLKLTPIRRAVLEALYATHRPISAYDAIDALAAATGKREAPVTVYRALDFLRAAGLAHKLESRNAYIACPFHHMNDEPVVFLICERCGGVDEAISDPLARALSGLIDSHGFSPRQRVIEVQGACAHCRTTSE